MINKQIIQERIEEIEKQIAVYKERVSDIVHESRKNGFHAFRFEESAQIYDNVFRPVNSINEELYAINFKVIRLRYLIKEFKTFL